MNDLAEYFEKVLQGLKTLNADIGRMKKLKKDVDESTGDEIKKKKEASFHTKSFQSITTLRSSVKEAKEAKENPEVTFIEDQLIKIFGD